MVDEIVSSLFLRNQADGYMQYSKTFQKITNDKFGFSLGYWFNHRFTATMLTVFLVPAGRSRLGFSFLKERKAE